MIQTAMLVLVLVAIYSLVIAGLVWFIGRLGVSERHTVFLGFVSFGLVTGVLTVLLWPNDSCVLPNIFGVWLGDWIYIHAIEWMGDPHSSQAHDTVAWVFRVPQIYWMASTGLCAVLGLITQWTKERLVFERIRGIVGSN